MAMLLMTDSGGQTKHILVGRIPLLFGRGEHCDVILGSRSVPRELMRIREEDGKVKVEDLTDGTGIRRKGSAVGGVFELTPRETLEAGRFVFQVLEATDVMVTAPICAVVPHQLPYLFCLKGQLKGQTFSLRVGRNEIGRDPDATVHIDDPNISRTHASLFIQLPPPSAGGEDPVMTICDLSSSNGTFLNRQRVTRATPIASGDILALGKLPFRFVCESREDEAPPKQQRLVLKAFLAFVGLIVFVQVAAVLVAVFEPVAAPPRGELSIASNRPRRSPEAANQSSALFASVERALKNQDWLQAEIHIDQLLGRDPGSARALALRTALEDGRKQQGLYDQAMLLARQGKHKEALVALSRIPERSTYAREARSRKEQLRKELGEDARRALMAGEEERAYHLFLSYLELFPCDPAVPEKVIRKLEALLRRRQIPFRPYEPRCPPRQP